VNARVGAFTFRSGTGPEQAGHMAPLTDDVKFRRTTVALVEDRFQRASLVRLTCARQLLSHERVAGKAEDAFADLVSGDL
jgi:hypothetical protein